MFDLRERAERVLNQLLTDGHEWGYVRFPNGPDMPSEYVDEWSASGHIGEIECYTGELRAGRWLIAVWCHVSDVAGSRSVFGRPRRSVRSPPEGRNMKCCKRISDTR